MGSRGEGAQNEAYRAEQVSVQRCKWSNFDDFVATRVNFPLDLTLVREYIYRHRTTQGDDEAKAFVTFTR